MKISFKKDRAHTTRKSFRMDQGWATMELVLLLPCLFGLIALVFYFGQLSFLKLHLTNVTDAAARIAAIKNCSSANQYIRESFSTSPNQLQIDCSEGELISLKVTSQLKTSLPFLNIIDRKIIVHSYAINEKQLSNNQQ